MKEQLFNLNNAQIAELAKSPEQRKEYGVGDMSREADKLAKAATVKARQKTEIIDQLIDTKYADHKETFSTQEEKIALHELDRKRKKSITGKIVSLVQEGSVRVKGDGKLEIAGGENSTLNDNEFLKEAIENYQFGEKSKLRERAQEKEKAGKQSLGEQAHRSQSGEWGGFTKAALEGDKTVEDTQTAVVATDMQEDQKSLLSEEPTVVLEALDIKSHKKKSRRNRLKGIVRKEDPREKGGKIVPEVWKSQIELDPTIKPRLGPLYDETFEDTQDDSTADTTVLDIATGTNIVDSEAATDNLPVLASKELAVPSSDEVQKEGKGRRLLRAVKERGLTTLLALGITIATPFLTPAEADQQNAGADELNPEDRGGALVDETTVENPNLTASAVLRISEPGTPTIAVDLQSESGEAAEQAEDTTEANVREEVIALASQDKVAAFTPDTSAEVPIYDAAMQQPEEVEVQAVQQQPEVTPELQPQPEPEPVQQMDPEPEPVETPSEPETTPEPESISLPTVEPDEGKACESEDPFDPEVQKAKNQVKQIIVGRYGYSTWEATKKIMCNESGWKIYVPNGNDDGGCGLPQATPCSKMLDGNPAEAGGVLKYGIGSLDNVEGQVEWFIDYNTVRYGSIEAGAAHRDITGNY